jgi:hypothetical protein
MVTMTMEAATVRLKKLNATGVKLSKDLLGGNNLTGE